MKYLFAIITVIAVFIFGSPAHADALNMLLQQRNATDTGNVNRLLATPASLAVWIYDPTTNLPGYLNIGGGLSITGGDTLVATGTAPTWASITGKPTFASVAITGAYTDLSGTPSLATVATSGAYADLTGKPTIPTVAAFNFSLPSAKTIVTGTDYQAADPTKAAIITYSASCSNNSTLVAANPCTLTVRMGSSAVTCSTGTVYSTLSAVVSLGLVITQTNITPPQVNMPIGAHTIFCATAGTWTITAVEQSAG